MHACMHSALQVGVGILSLVEEEARCGNCGCRVGTLNIKLLLVTGSNYQG